ncbi:YegP family protein [Nocardia sp. XZ_19_369]|uniref:YegP family protein n=1 Tax=Nocardia sp. XZ_19_369 TaxID=2769487 RepID=UPI00188E501F|nr:YegP family protein [Nocardia sp. XZ_19_369]
MAAKFEIYQDKADKYRFRLKAANGEVIAVGEAYESKAACKNGIESIKKNAAAAEIVDQTLAGV